MSPLTNLPPLVGIGLKPQHYPQVLAGLPANIPVAFLEVHPQNYACAGGPPHRWLTAIAEHLPLSFHSVGLSLGSAAGVNRDELERLAALCARYQPAAVSDHLSWSDAPGHRFPDLLPLPYTQAVLDHFAAQVDIVQNRLQRKMLVENPSRYLAFARADMDEAEFLHALCHRTGCGLLLDINNIEVTATNLGLDAQALLDAIDPALVGEVHLAGHAIEHHDDGPLLIDDHGSAVSALTWSLYDRFIRRAGPRPTLIEWDSNIPPFDTLIAQAAKAASILMSPVPAEPAREHA